MKTELPILDPIEIRLLGCLIEKSQATPEYYPMTVNGLTTACNQKTSRKPVMNLSEQEVMLGLDRLKVKQLISTVTGAGTRSMKYRHTIAVHYPLTPDQLSVLCLLMLRGPLTPGEINNSSGRLFSFDDLSEVNQVLEGLRTFEPAFVQLLERQPGQKEARYYHLLGSAEDMKHFLQDERPSHDQQQVLEARIEQLEEQVAAMKTKLDYLYQSLVGNDSE